MLSWYVHPESDCVLLKADHPGPECDELGPAADPPSLQDFCAVYRQTCEHEPPLYLQESASRELQRHYNAIAQKAGISSRGGSASQSAHTSVR
jgi:hypothetical protein